MAEALAVEFVKSFGEKVFYKVFNEIVFAKDINSHLESLKNAKITIEALLLDMDTLPSVSHGQELFLERLSRAMDRADDLLDEEATRVKIQLMGGRGRSRVAKQAVLFLSASSNPIFCAFRSAKQVKAIRKELDSIAKDSAQFGNLLSMFPVTVSQTSQTLKLETGSYLLKEEVIGRDGDRDNIISKLFAPSSNTNGVSVVSIVGIGGIGKTTLAQYVYNDERVTIKYDLRLWVHATQNFEAKEMLQTILASSTDGQPVHYDMDSLQRRLLKEISGKKFLLVLDNVWDHNNLRSNWEEVRKILVSGASGSRILITTRSQSVATTIGMSNEPYLLEDLAPGDSWLLFQRVAFEPWQESGVEVIGEEIAKMGRNVPLVIRTIGGLLAEKRTVQEWRDFRDNKFANLSLYGGNIVQTLKLSYDDLDPTLKLCFAYCSLFPKRFRFHGDELYTLFISLGYVNKKCKNQSLMDAGVECVLNLVNRGLLHETIFSFEMHDLIHDLATSIGGYKHKMVDCEAYEFDERVCHVSFTEKADICLDSLSNSRHLQSFHVWGDFYWHPELKGLSRLSRYFPYLRVLSLRELEMEEVPRSIGRLIHLRYLDLSKNIFSKLPKELTQLVNLLFLNLFECKNLAELPGEMGKLVSLVSLDLTLCEHLEDPSGGLSKLVNLKHLQLEGCERLWGKSIGLGNLTSLETLDEFESNDGNELSELNSLNNLEETLKIRLYDSSRRTTNLQLKDKLMALKFEFIELECPLEVERETDEEIWEKEEKILEDLQPQSNLRELYIFNYKGKRLPSWMMKNQLHSCLPNLVNISIGCAPRLRNICSFGRLPHLEHLYLSNLLSVEYMEEENTASTTTTSGEGVLFPSLKYLYIAYMPKLKEWWRTCTEPNAFPKLNDLRIIDVGFEVIPDDFRGLSSLQMLHIAGWKQLKEIPEWIDDLTSLQSFEILKCPKLTPLPKQIGNLLKLEVIHVNRCPAAFAEWWKDPTLPDCPFKYLTTQKWHDYDDPHGFFYDQI